MQQSSQSGSDTIDEPVVRSDSILAFYRTIVSALDADVRRALEASAVAMSRSHALLAKLERDK